MPRMLRVAVVLIFLFLFGVSSAGGQEPSSSSELPPDPASLLTDPVPILVEPHGSFAYGGGLLYWEADCAYQVDPSPVYIRRQPETGGAIQTLFDITSPTVAQCSSVSPYNLADDDGFFYYNLAEDRIDARLSHDPTASVALINDLGTPQPVMATDDDYLYVNRPLGIFRSAKDSLGATKINNATGVKGLAVDDTYIYWLDATAVWRASKTCLTPSCWGSKEQLSSVGGDKYLNWTEDGNLIWVAQRLGGWSIMEYDTFLDTTSSLYWSSDENTWNIGRPVTHDGCYYWLEDRNPDLVSLNDFLRRRCGGTAETIAVDLYAPDMLAVGPLGVVFSNSMNDGIYRLDFDAEAITKDFYLDAMEVTQGIQNLYQEVDLVAQKTTYVRVFGGNWSDRGADAVQVALRGWRDGTELADSPLYPVGTPRSLGPLTAWDRNNPEDAWLFQLPQSWIQEGTLALTAKVDPHNAYSDPNPGDNSVATTVTFERRAPVCYVFVSVSTEAGIALKDQSTVGPMVGLAERLLPVPDLRVYHQHGVVEELELCWAYGFIPYACHGPYEMWQNSLWGDWVDDGTKVVTDIATRYTFSDLDCDGGRVQFVGLVHEDSYTDGVNGMGRLDSHASWVQLAQPESYLNRPTKNPWTWPRSGSTLAHETGHNIERHHVDCGGPSNLDTAYPYTDANGEACILDDGALASYGTHFGFDINTLQPIAPNTQYLSDVMSYSSTRWMSDYTWEAYFDKFPMGPAPDLATSAGVDLATADSVVLIGGIVSPPAGEGRLNYAWVYPTESVSSQVLAKLQALAAPVGDLSLAVLPGDGSREVPVDQYELRLRDANGAVLADYPFVPDIVADSSSPDELAGFLLSFPAPTVQVAQIELLSYGTVVDRLEPGPSTPAVAILQPAGGETMVDGMTIVWQATDADPDDQLLFTVQYSPDLGQTWRTIVTDWPGPYGSDIMTLALDGLLGIPGSTTGGVVRVVASDGYNTAMATSEPFVVENQPPLPYIASPAPAQVFKAGDPVLLRGDASDEEDGSVSDASLSWDVTGQATLTGKEVFLAGLAPGDYDVVLTAEDSDGATGTAETALVVSPLSVPDLPWGADLPELDGFCDDAVYQSGVLVGLKPYPDGRQAAVRLIRSDDYLWACFSGLARGSESAGSRPQNSAGLVIDGNYSREHALQAGDAWVYVQEDGTPTVWTGPAWGGDSTPDGLQSRVSANDNAWTAELRLDASLLGGWGHLAGLELVHVWVPDSGGGHYSWPFAANTVNPDSWATTVLGKWPRIDDLSPSEALESTNGTVIAISGHDLESGAVALWNGAPRPTTFVNSTGVLMTLEAGDLSADGTAEIRLQNPGLGAAPSNPLTFTIKNPVPEITEIIPVEATAGSDDLLIGVTGLNFDEEAVALWNGEPKETVVTSDTFLRFIAKAADLATVRDVGITVENLGPGGGVSEVFAFTILAPPNLPPNAPYAPDPADDATGVPTNQVLTWQGSDPEGQPLRYDVAFGTDKPPTVATGLADASYDPGPLEPGTVYNWRITACDGQDCTIGETWSFTTAVEPVPNQPPYVPSRPNPSDGLTNVPVNQVLSWSGGDPDGDTVNYTVALGTMSSPPVEHPTTHTSYTPDPPLEPGETYFWQVTATDGEETVVGPLWSFTTLPDNLAPYVPSRPSPSDGEQDVELDPVLSWVGGDPDGDHVTYTVYLGTSDPLPRVSEALDDPSFPVGPLDPDTRYRWYVTAWDGEILTTGPTWSFITIPPNLPPYPPYKPDPADRETGVPTDQVLNWLASDPERDPLTYDIYFGDTNPPPLEHKGLSSPSFDPGLLEPDTRYYWGVTVKDDEGHSTAGSTWSFMTAPANLPPNEPYAPYPADSESDVPLDQLLAWRCYDPDRDTLTYDVYFGTTNPPPNVEHGLDTARYNPGALNPGTPYYWQIVAFDGTDTTEGPVWRFRTTELSSIYLPLILKQ